MGLIHSRARKKRDRAEARYHQELTRQLREERTAQRAEDAGDSLLRQPTLGALLSAAARRRRNRGRG